MGMHPHTRGCAKISGMHLHTLGYPKAWSLGVSGAFEDSRRIADMIDTYRDDIDEIYLALDTHHKLHIAHAKSWTRGTITLKKYNDMHGTSYKVGDNPAPLTMITHDDVMNGIWIPGTHLDPGWCQEYTKKLEVGRKFKLTIWPEHCLIGTKGHAVVDVISLALQEWSKERQKTVSYVRVGENIRTEAYSIFRAEVLDPSDPTVSVV